MARSVEQMHVKKVLVVDDSETVRLQIRNALAPAGYDVIEAVDGLDGLERIRVDLALDLVLCDVNMPRMSGLDMIDQLKAEGLTRIPVVMLTSEGQSLLVRRAKEAGAKGWIVKPFKVDLLLSAVNKLVAA